MGCGQSKIENEEAVTRCKDRKQFMKDAVSARNAFAAAHSAYTMSLKNTGAALSDFAHGEVQNPNYIPTATTTTPLHQAATPASADGEPQPPPPPHLQSSYDTLLPPPPPFNSAFAAPPLQRAASMPEMKIPLKGESSVPAGPTIIEEEEDDEVEMENHEKLVTRKKRGSYKGSGSNSSKREVAENDPPPPQAMASASPSSHPPAVESRAAAMQSPELGWADYIFQPPQEGMMGPTLAAVQEEAAAVAAGKVEEIEQRKVFDGRPKRVDDVEEVRKSAKAEVAPEKVPVVEAVPVVGGGTGGSVGKSVKKGKASVATGERRVVKVGSVSLLKIFVDLDDDFLKASESAHEVSKLLEATRLHYHSNFADNRGHIDHSARVMRVITWNRSFKGLPNVDDGKDDFDSEEHETHATVLDKLLAWEKKLYDEVKAGEFMKFEYQRKVAMLNKQKRRGTNSEALEKAKAAVSHLHTRYIVDMQSMDSTVSEINRLRDQQLYPKLVHLVNGMAIMWDTMRLHHESQSKIVIALRAVDLSQSPKETSEHHHERTIQLWAVVQEWHSQFCKLIDHQKGYIKALNNWLKLNLIPIESSLREKVSSPPRVQNPPIQALLHAWHDHLERLPDEVARTAIHNFAAVVNAIMHHQEEEMKKKDKCEETRKELVRKSRQFDEWHNKYMQRRTPDDLDPRADDNMHTDVVAERQFVVEILKKRLEEEEEDYQRHCTQVREKSLASLKTHLPELFRATSDIARACSEMYKLLRSIAQHLSQNPSGSSS